MNKILIELSVLLCRLTPGKFPSLLTRILLKGKVYDTCLQYLNTESFYTKYSKIGERRYFQIYIRDLIRYMYILCLFFRGFD